MQEMLLVEFLELVQTEVRTEWQDNQQAHTGSGVSAARPGSHRCSGGFEVAVDPGVSVEGGMTTVASTWTCYMDYQGGFYQIYVFLHIIARRGRPGTEAKSSEL